MRRIAAAAVAAIALSLTPTTQAMDLTSIDFESGNLLPAGDPSDGWKLWSVSGNNRATIGSTGRAFATGTAANDEALFIRPATPGATESDLEGAEFTTSTPLTFGQNDILYLITETFSDISAFSDQYLKMDVRIGVTGDGGAYGGFDSITAGGSQFSINHNYNTEPSNSNRQGRVGIRQTGGSNTTAEVLDARYVGDDVTDGIGDVDNNPGTPANNFLDRTYVTKTIYRPGAGDGTQVNAESQGLGFDGSSFVTTQNKEATDDNPAVDQLLPAYSELSFDRISVHMRRHIGTYDGILVGQPDELANGFAGHTGLASPFAPDGMGIVPNGADIKMGIKSLRFGIAQPGDFNLDGVVDGADEAIAQGNQGMTDATFFDGDADNDGDVDMDDLSIFPGIPGDFDGDGDVDTDDFGVFVASFQNSPQGGPPFAQGDFDEDGDVDTDDFGVFVSSFQNFPPTPGVAVPEPGAVALVALVFAGALGRGRRVGA